MRSNPRRRRDPAPLRPLEGGERWIITVLALLFGGLLLAEILDESQPGKLAFLFMVLAWAPLLVIHELGHALAAGAVGWRVCRVVIGFGRILAVIRVGRAVVEVKALPVCGYVVPAPTSLSWARTKNALVFAAGPGIELLLLGALVAAIGSETLWSPTLDPGVMAAQGTAVAIVIGVVLNLIPYTTAEGLATDGLGILLSPSIPRRTFERWMAIPDVLESRQLLASGDVDGALRVVARGLVRQPGAVELECQEALCLAACDRGDDAASALRALGDPESRPPDERALIQHTRALVALETRSSTMMLHAERCAREAFDVYPDSIEYQITHAFFVLELHHPNDAVPLLEEALCLTNDDRDRNRCLAGLALAKHRLGETERALSYYQSLEHGTASRLVEYVGSELGVRSGAPSR